MGQSEVKETQRGGGCSNGPQAVWGEGMNFALARHKMLLKEEEKYVGDLTVFLNRPATRNQGVASILRMRTFESIMHIGSASLAAIFLLAACANHCSIFGSMLNFIAFCVYLQPSYKKNYDSWVIDGGHCS